MSEEVPNETKQASTSQAQAKEGKYLSFRLGEEDYGIEILTVREIIGMMDITHIPQVPVYVKGIINLRGKVIPVIDLRMKFGLQEIEPTSETCIIVVNIEELLIGLLIDKVNEVLDIVAENIEPAPRFGTAIDTEFILGIGKIAESIKILLNIARVLSDDIALVQRVESS